MVRTIGSNLVILISASSMHHHRFRRLRFLPFANVLFQLGAELGDDVLHRPAGAVGKAANGCSRHDADGAADLFENVQVLQTSLAASNSIDHLFHPAGSFPAGSALAARFVREESAAVI